MATAPVEAIADEAFGAYLEKSETVLVVMDVHQNWCGSCDTMKPTYNSILTRSTIARTRSRLPRGHWNIDAAAWSSWRPNRLIGPGEPRLHALFLLARIRRLSPSSSARTCPRSEHGPLRAEDEAASRPLNNPNPRAQALGDWARAMVRQSMTRF